MVDDGVPCTICGGGKAEHEGRAHKYTVEEGDLETPKAAAEKDFKNRIPIPSPPAGGEPLGRLIKVLTLKGLLDINDVLYIGGLQGEPTVKGVADNGDGS